MIIRGRQFGGGKCSLHVQKRFSALGVLVFCVSNCPMLIRLAPGFEDAATENVS